jgi:uncharacterized protein YaaR (DUF327 family)
MKEQEKIELERLENAISQIEAAVSRGEKWATSRKTITDVEKFKTRISELINKYK